MANNTPWSVQYPVAFRAGGDTTRDAFGKHIQEIERIYGILNSLNSSKLDSTTFNDRLNEHINTSSNPHPNYHPSFSDITGNLDMSRITGNLDGSRITGTLSNAVIPNTNITGLQQYVQNLLPEDNGDGITDAELSEVGSITFKNGLIVKWGNGGKLFEEERWGTYKFPAAFPEVCYAVVLSYTTTSPYANDSSGRHDDSWVQLTSYDKKGFNCVKQADNGNSSAAGDASVTYLAIGK